MPARAAPSNADASPAPKSSPGEAGEPAAPGVRHVPAVTRWRGYHLNDFQVRAIEAIKAGHNVLVGAPTGAGKTLVAEYAIEDAVRARRRCIYTSPIKALSNQKYRDFRDDPLVDVGLLTGDVTIHPTAQVLIMTTEILRNAIFEDPRQLADVEYVVFDEVHFLDDAERGTVWEESLIFAPPSVRFICLSATVSNIGELGAWIGEIREQELVVIESRNRPVPLTHRLYHPSRGVFPLGELSKVRRRARHAGERRGGGRSGRRQRGRQEAERRPPPAPTDPRRLLDELQAQALLPVLVFSFSRKDCERLAVQDSRRDLLDEAEHAAMGALQEELVRVFQLQRSELDGQVLSMARRGIGYHHAGMLPIHKELVERMFTSGLLKMLFTTETFALGINMPARAVVFHSLRKFDGVSVDYLRTREYMQMAGRAGRQGIDTEGLVFSVLDERDLAEGPLERILSGQPEPVQSRFRLSYSSILHLLSSLGRERLHEAWEKSFHQFQHREKSEKSRQKARARQRQLLEAHLGFLEAADYVEAAETLTPKGRLAQKLNGYEIQCTELLFRGALEELPPPALAMVFVGLVYEERRRGRPPFVPQRMYAGVRRHVTQLLIRTLHSEAQFEVPVPLKLPDWGLTPAVLVWCEGASMAELERVTDVTPGDLCRTFRMAIQLIRQVRRAIDPAWDLEARLGKAQESLNRDEIDARRQLELG